MPNKRFLFSALIFALAGAGLWSIGQENPIQLTRKEIVLPETDPGIFKSAAAIQAYGNHIFIVDNALHRVLEFEAGEDQLKYIRTYGKHGQGPGDIELPMYISVDEGRLAVRDEYGISLFDLAGKFVNKFRLLSMSLSIVLADHKLCVLIADPTKRTYIEVYSLEGALLSSFGNKKDLSFEYPFDQEKSPDSLDWVFMDGFLTADKDRLYYLNRRFGDAVTFDFSGKVVARRNVASSFGEEGPAKRRENERLFLDNKFDLAKDRRIPNHYIHQKVQIFQHDLVFMTAQFSFLKKKWNPFVEFRSFDKDRFDRPKTYRCELPEKERVLQFTRMEGAGVPYFMVLTTGEEGYKMYKLTPSKKD